MRAAQARRELSLARPQRIFIVAGEASGDELGALLMRALRAVHPNIQFAGVGSEAMKREGVESLFPLSDISVMGLLPVLARLPQLIVRIEQTARAIVDTAPDCLVIVDSPDFTHRVARRVRRALPQLPIVDYVSPTVWAWRPGRARAMRNYIDHVLALLPFEPAAYARLGGPACSYVGHPLIEHLEELSPNLSDRRERPLLLVLPGSRAAEVMRLLPVYGEALRLLFKEIGEIDVAVPVVSHVENLVRDGLRNWPVRPQLVSKEEKFLAFRSARAALVTSGVATLELALANVPMAVAYKVSRAEYLLKFLVSIDSIVLPNLIAGENAVPEFLQSGATPRALADALTPLVRSGPSRDAQLTAFARVRGKILAAGRCPSAQAAEIVLRYAAQERKSRGC
jgi:lipid-A-disaccharide synthase